MEMANTAPSVRMAAETDHLALQKLLREAHHRHLHADWYLPSDWLGNQGFVVYEERGKVSACLAATAESAPAAWVRVAALPFQQRPFARLSKMLDVVKLILRQQGLEQLFWLTDWPSRWLEILGFRPYTFIETYLKDNLALPLLPQRASSIQIRPVRSRDMPALAHLETAAFAPPWRSSERGLRRAWQQSSRFEVAEANGRLLGYQHTLIEGAQVVHLSRLAVHPDFHGHGVGSILLAHTLTYYQRLGLQEMTLNTQANNDSSQHLYTKFGFQPTHERQPVWVCDLYEPR